MAVVNRVGIDRGQSSIRLRSAGGEGASEVVWAGVNRTLMDDVGAIGAIRRKAGLVDAMDVVSIGHTAYPEEPRLRLDFASAIARLFNAREVRLYDDWVSAHAGALGGAPGVVVVAGTGTAGLGISQSGVVSRVDGNGHLFGDGGSAYAIERAGIALALRHLDGRSAAPLVYALAISQFGGPLRSAVLGLGGSSDRVMKVAGFARHIVEAAESGDPNAGRIVASAVRELADTAVAAVRGSADRLDSREGEDPVASYCGGVFRSSLIVEGFVRELSSRAPGVSVVSPMGEPVDGSLLLAGPIPQIYIGLVDSYVLSGGP